MKELRWNIEVGRWIVKPVVFSPGPSIIVIGPDGVGKTTVVNTMSKFTGIPTFKSPNEKEIFRNGGRSSLAFDYTLTHFLRQTEYRFISDRGYPCEFVYASVFGRDTDEELIWKIDENHAAMGTMILYLYSSIQPSEPDDIVPSDMYWTVKEGYDRFVSLTKCDVFTYDTAQSLHLSGRERAEFDTSNCLEMLADFQSASRWDM